LTTRGIRGGQVAETNEHKKAGAFDQRKTRREEVEAGREVVLKVTPPA
jgi:hypothetical protein